MPICKICKRSFENINSLAKHIHHSHPNITRKEYYDKHISEISPICVCGKEKRFIGLSKGYGKYCSIACRTKYNKPTAHWKGKKQPKEMVEKRLRNTDQKSKEDKRKQTMIKKYGVDNPSLVPEFLDKISSSNKGKKQPRTKEHQQKIVQSKKRNGTQTHSSSTRKKISETLNTYYQKGNDQSITVTKSTSNGRGHKVGYIDGIMFRSSYEELFILFCKTKKIEIKSCENKQHRVRYVYQNKKRWYYPDFYLPELDICVEIKPKSMINELTEIKASAAQNQYNNFIILTEEELLDDEKLYLTFFPS